jgi:SAM-dependent methyltransferase
MMLARELLRQLSNWHNQHGMKCTYYQFDSECQRLGHRGLVAAWSLTERLLEDRWVIDGMPILCSICSDITRLAPVEVERSIDPREGMLCGSCGMSARLRAGTGLLAKLADPDDAIYITEQSTKLYALMQSRYAHLRGSEFESDKERRLQLAGYLASVGGHGEIRFEDVTQLSMEDASLVAVVSFDVLEHVPDYRRALREFRRVLQPGGALIATFPFTDAAQTIIRASLADDGQVVHYLEPEFHGDPVGGRVLCFQHFGWDVLDAAREAGFTTAQMVMPWAPEQGLLYGNWTFVAKA